MALRKSLSDLRGATLLFSEQTFIGWVKWLPPLLKGKDWISAIVVRTPTHSRWVQVPGVCVRVQP